MSLEALVYFYSRIQFARLLKPEVLSSTVKCVRILDAKVKKKYNIKKKYLFFFILLCKKNISVREV